MACAVHMTGHLLSHAFTKLPHPKPLTLLVFWPLPLMI